MNHYLILLAAAFLSVAIAFGLTAIDYKRKGEAFIVSEHLLFFGVAFGILALLVAFIDQIAVQALFVCLVGIGIARLMFPLLKASGVADVRYPQAQGFVSTKSKNYDVKRGIILLVVFGLFWVSFLGHDRWFEKWEDWAIGATIFFGLLFFVLLWWYSRPIKR